MGGLQLWYRILCSQKSQQHWEKGKGEGGGRSGCDQFLSEYSLCSFVLYCVHRLDCINIDQLFFACVGESELPGWLVENEQFNALIAEAEKLVSFLDLALTCVVNYKIVTKLLPSVFLK